MICHCTLPYYNPDACKRCGIYTDVKSNYVCAPILGLPIGIEQNPEIGARDVEKFVVIKTKRTIERFDKNGNLLERIVEEDSNE